MKHLKFIIIPLLSLILASCGSNLPAKSSLEAGEGIFAIPKSLIKEVNLPYGVKTYLQVSDTNGKVVDELIHLRFIKGRQFHFVKNLSPGQYTVSGFRQVHPGKTLESYIPMYVPMMGFKVDKRSISFTIFEGEVTVSHLYFDLQFKAMDDGRGGYIVLYFKTLVDEYLEEFKAVMAKVNKNNEWKVNWPK